MAVNGEKVELVRSDTQHSFSHQQGLSWRHTNLSQEIPILSERGISQVLPDALQAELQHAIIISSSGTADLDMEPPIEIEQQVDVVTMESCDLESEQEVENDLEQILDEVVAVGAMEVTVWSTEDQEAVPIETDDMINQSSSSFSDHLPSDGVYPTYSSATNHVTVDNLTSSLDVNTGNHTPPDHSSSSDVPKRLPSATRFAPQCVEGVNIDSYPVPCPVERAGDVTPENMGDEHVVFPSDDAVGDIEVSTVQSESEAEVTVGAGEGKELNIVASSAGTAIHGDESTIDVESFSVETSSLALNVETTSSPALPISTEFEGHKKAVVIPREMDSALEVFSMDEISSARMDDTSTVQVDELPGEREEGRFTEHEAEICAEREDNIDVDELLEVTEEVALRKSEVSVLKKDKVHTRLPTAEKNVLPAVKKKAVVIPRGIDGTLDIFSREEVGTAEEECGLLTAEKDMLPAVKKKKAVVIPRGMDVAMDIFSQEEVGAAEETAPQIVHLSNHSGEENLVCEVITVDPVTLERSMNALVGVSQTSQPNTQYSNVSSKSLFSSNDVSQQSTFHSDTSLPGLAPTDHHHSPPHVLSPSLSRKAVTPPPQPLAQLLPLSPSRKVVKPLAQLFPPSPVVTAPPQPLPQSLPLLPSRKVVTPPLQPLPRLLSSSPSRTVVTAPLQPLPRLLPPSPSRTVVTAPPQPLPQLLPLSPSRKVVTLPLQPLPRLLPPSPSRKVVPPPPQLLPQLLPPSPSREVVTPPSPQPLPPSPSRKVVTPPPQLTEPQPTGKTAAAAYSDTALHVLASPDPVALQDDDFLYQTDSEACSGSEFRLDSPGNSQSVQVDKTWLVMAGATSAEEEEEEEEEMELAYPITSMVIRHDATMTMTPPIHNISPTKDNKTPPPVTPTSDVTPTNEAPPTNTVPSVKPTDEVPPTSKGSPPTTSALTTNGAILIGISALSSSPQVDLSPLLIPSPLPISLPPFLKAPSDLKALIRSAVWAKISDTKLQNRSRTANKLQSSTSFSDTSPPHVVSEDVRITSMERSNQQVLVKGYESDEIRGSVEAGGLDQEDVVVVEDEEEEVKGDGVSTGIEVGIVKGLDNGASREDLEKELPAGGVDEGMLEVVSAGGTEDERKMDGGTEDVPVQEKEMDGGTVPVQEREMDGGTVPVQEREMDGGTVLVQEREMDGGTIPVQEREMDDTVQGGVDLPSTLIVDVEGSQSPSWCQIETSTDTQSNDPTDPIDPRKRQKRCLSRSLSPSAPANPPREKRLRLDRPLAPKDSTGEITMGTPHYSLNPFQQTQEAWAMEPAAEEMDSAQELLRETLSQPLPDTQNSCSDDLAHPPSPPVPTTNPPPEPINVLHSPHKPTTVPHLLPEPPPEPTTALHPPLEPTTVPRSPPEPPHSPPLSTAAPHPPHAPEPTTIPHPPTKFTSTPPEPELSTVPFPLAEPTIAPHPLPEPTTDQPDPPEPATMSRSSPPPAAQNIVVEDTYEHGHILISKSALSPAQNIEVVEDTYEYGYTPIPPTQNIEVVEDMYTYVPLAQVVEDTYTYENGHTPVPIVRIVHSHYMSGAMQSCKLRPITLSDLWSTGTS